MTSWIDKLNKRDIKHLKATVPEGRRPTLATLKGNLTFQRRNGIRCFNCELIAGKLGIPLPALRDDKGESA